MGRPPASLSRRILWAFAGAGFLFNLAALGLLIATYEAGQESLSQKILMTEVSDYLAERQLDPNREPPRAALVRSYVGEQLPSRYRDHLESFEIEDYDIPLREWNEVQLWQGETLSGEALFVIFDPGLTDDSAIRDPNLLRLFVVWLPLLGGFSIWLSWLISRRLSAPLSRLAAKVTHYDPSSTDQDELEIEGDSEVQAVAGAFRALQARIESFVERERDFTRFASHELRTPITVARGSAEVLRRMLPEPQPKVDRALLRMEQAMAEMSTTVDLFLWLAREEEEPHREAISESAEVVRQLVEVFRPMLSSSVEIDLDLRVERHRQFPTNLFRIAASNLIRNAFQHTPSGRVTILLDEYGFEVSDSGKGMSIELLSQVRTPLVRGADGEGSGLGLSIVERLAIRCGWALVLDSELGKGTRSVLRFQTNSG